MVTDRNSRITMHRGPVHRELVDILDDVLRTAARLELDRLEPHVQARLVLSDYTTAHPDADPVGVLVAATTALANIVAHQLHQDGFDQQLSRQEVLRCALRIAAEDPDNPPLDEPDTLAGG